MADIFMCINTYHSDSVSRIIVDAKIIIFVHVCLWTVEY